jgi:hypothetical protein
LIWGLKYIFDVFNSILKRHPDLPLDDIKKDKQKVESIIGYYEENKHLNTNQVGIESLQFLKAAAITKIVQLEHRKVSERISRVIKAINKEIYYIIVKLRNPPFVDIKLPDVMATIRESFPQPQLTTPSSQVIFNDSTLSQSEPEIAEHYNVSFSLAHEQHEYVDKVFIELKEIAPSLKVFYYRDGGQKINLWGRSMFTHLQTVYRDSSDHVIIFVSSDYVEKRWAAHEWRSVQEAILDRSEEYLLPARFDDTKLDGMPETIGYIDLKNISPRAFAEMIESKISPGNKKK